MCGPGGAELTTTENKFAILEKVILPTRETHYDRWWIEQRWGSDIDAWILDAVRTPRGRMGTATIIERV